ncbi:hypothetical protein BG005_011044 [Podila minutissima]|nr:hypothetical protein BG005_011044 [Podila minutissima]
MFAAARTHFGVEGTRLGVRYLQKKGRGGVIIKLHLASLAGLYRQPRTPAYSAAKFGVMGLTRSFKDFPDNIRMNALAPLFADTKIIDRACEYITSLNAMVTVDQVIDAFMLFIEDDS